MKRDVFDSAPHCTPPARQPIQRGVGIWRRVRRKLVKLVASGAARSPHSSSSSFSRRPTTSTRRAICIAVRSVSIEPSALYAVSSASWCPSRSAAAACQGPVEPRHASAQRSLDL